MTSSQYRFVGSEAFVCTDSKAGKGVQFKLFGQSAILQDDIAHDAVLNSNAAIIPDADFQALGFTDAELKQYGTTRAREGALPTAFAAKLRAAWAALAAYKSALKNPPAQTAELEHND